MKGKLFMALKNMVLAIGAIFLLWLLLSWGNVIMNNNPASPGTIAGWNAFKLLTQLGDMID